MQLNADAFKTELFRILSYWEKYAPDMQRGGFYGSVSFNNVPQQEAPRSVVVNSRILWTFSMAHRLFPNPDYKAMADRAFQYLIRHFFDPEFGGVYWSVTAKGKPLETTKQMYGQAFAMYGLSEYYRAFKVEKALTLAKGLFDYIEKSAFDGEEGGYLEAIGRKGEPIDNYLLSQSPYSKSMNTHLHLIEAYTNLFTVWPDAKLKKQTTAMLLVIMDRIVDDTDRMKLFFTKKWIPKDKTISYGHDIEASWLLYETAELLGDHTVTETVRDRCLKMAEAATAGLGSDGALNYEYFPETHHLQTNRSWWVLAEQVVGFYNAYQMSGNEKYLKTADRSWEYIQQKFMDTKRGEWHTTVLENGTAVDGDKIHFWKAPYHNARMCVQMWQRLS
ncbi:AGE family epimerase/isomerase [Persicitalea jodogahamensis]|uniref:Cellobiose 2-epimerase n=1 Tax=Persicitalea jodogahamensis TaxID=402147 RepID=A0A8J3D4Y6_9BACT|nr:AGE family epimerase/isomerase [Persicitalea jodogahamensis]GHB76101.1 cellobiose 2-epimerase [Persicitalea jodogahamensis]